MAAASRSPSTLDPDLVRTALSSDEFVRRTSHARSGSTDAQHRGKNCSRAGAKRSVLEQEGGKRRQLLAAGASGAENVQPAVEASSRSSPVLGSSSPRLASSSSSRGSSPAPLHPTSSTRQLPHPRGPRSAPKLSSAASGPSPDPSSSASTSTSTSTPAPLSRPRSRMRPSRASTSPRLPTTTPAGPALLAPTPVYAPGAAQPPHAHRSVSHPVPLLGASSSYAGVEGQAQGGSASGTSTPSRLLLLRCGAVDPTGSCTPLPPCFTPMEVLASASPSAAADDGDAASAAGAGRVLEAAPLEKPAPALSSLAHCAPGEMGSSSLPSPLSSPPRDAAHASCSSTTTGPRLPHGHGPKSHRPSLSLASSLSLSMSAATASASHLPSPALSAGSGPPVPAPAPVSRSRTSTSTGTGARRRSSRAPTPMSTSPTLVPLFTGAGAGEDGAGEAGKRPELATYTSFEDAFGIPQPPSPPPSPPPPPPRQQQQAQDGGGRSWWSRS
ncbi:uncharacterized protein JCM10292_007256 [Rhodotorula paludigena]|uniref:uncharacterized protein n=1 Tax=Rhodotorula paludigena TaxID=86838 RepID=UPI0031813AFA